MELIDVVAVMPGVVVVLCIAGWFWYLGEAVESKQTVWLGIWCGFVIFVATAAIDVLAANPPDRWFRHFLIAVGAMGLIVWFGAEGPKLYRRLRA